MEIPGVEDLEEIGRGGMAVVYKGCQTEFSRFVAVKVVTAVGVDEALRRRFQQELRAVGGLSEHPNIITVHASGETAEGLPYLLMGYHPEGSLSDRVNWGGPLRWQEVAVVGVKMAGALESAHRAGVLHRDVKPENILVSSFGEPVLADFGIARLEGAAHITATGVVTGTIAHAAPETLEGKPQNAGSDVYGLASTLHQLLSGRSAFSRDTDESVVAVMRRVLTEPPPDLRAIGVPAPLATVVTRGMDKDPATRYQSAAELGQALRGAQTVLGVAPTPLPVALAPGDARRSGEQVVAERPIVPVTPTPPPATAPRPALPPPPTEPPRGRKKLAPPPTAPPVSRSLTAPPRRGNLPPPPRTPPAGAPR
jgi:serine/threonine protein kinase